MKLMITVQGKPCEVTDLPEALRQARMYVSWHESAKKDAETDDSVFYCEEAHQYWSDSLAALEELEKSQQKQQPTALTTRSQRR